MSLYRNPENLISIEVKGRSRKHFYLLFLLIWFARSEAETTLRLVRAPDLQPRFTHSTTPYAADLLDNACALFHYIKQSH